MTRIDRNVSDKAGFGLVKFCITRIDRIVSDEFGLVYFCMTQIDRIVSDKFELV